MNINPYLHFNGDCGQAFDFYEKLLKGKIVMKMTYADAPAGQCPPGGDPQSVMHITLDVNGQKFMASDAPPPYYQKPQGMRVSLGLSDVAEAERIFHGFAEGGTVDMPLQQTFWAARFGMVTDKWGIPWMVNCEASS